MEKAAPVVGIVASLLPAVAVFAPYVLLPAEEVAGLSQYYAFGVVSPWIVAIGGLVAAVAFAGGRAGNTDAETVAGATLAVGILLVVLAAQWALAVDVAVLQSVTSRDWMAHHRWAVVATTLPVPLVAGAYAWALDLV